MGENVEEKLTRFATYGALAFGLGYITKQVVDARTRRIDQLYSEICDLRMRVYEIKGGPQTPDVMETLAIKVSAALDELVQRKKAATPDPIAAAEPQPAQ
jgi:hypothetical protein